MGESTIGEKIRVALVGVRAIFRSGIRALVESEPTLALTAEADSLDAFIQATRNDDTATDVVVLAVRPGDGPDLKDIQSLLQYQPNVAPVVFATSNDSPGLQETLLAGARGYLDADSAHEDIVDALRVAGRGKCLQVPARSLLNVIRGLPYSQNTEGSSPGFARLTARELEILNAMSREESYRGIAAEFGLAPSSVKKYAHSIITKLGATNRSTAVIRAYRNGLLKTDSPVGGLPR